MMRDLPPRAASSAPDAWPFRDHRSMAQVVVDERQPVSPIDADRLHALLDRAAGTLGAAAAQLLPTDDAIIAARLREAHALVVAAREMVRL